MRKYAAGRTARSAAVFVLMLLLFPYIVSVFVNGAGSDEKPFHVRVRTEDGSGNETVAEVAWPEYLAGILALEMPEGCEPETAKALTVLIRTRLYRDAGSGENGSVKERFLTEEELAKRRGVEEAREIFETYVQAVNATDDTVLMYQDSYAWTPYFQSGSGKTRDAGEVRNRRYGAHVSGQLCVDALFSVREREDKGRRGSAWNGCVSLPCGPRMPGGCRRSGNAGV